MQQNNVDSLVGETSKSYALAPNIFHILDKQFQKPLKSFMMDCTLEAPIYAVSGPGFSVRTRIVAILRPESLKINQPSDTWIIGLTGNNVNNAPRPHLSQMIITNQYRIVHFDNIPESSFWKFRHHFGNSMTRQILVVNDSHSVHYQYWNCNVTTADIKAIANTGGVPLKIVGLLLPAFIRELDVGVFRHVYALGYRPGVDTKVSLIEQQQPIIIDQALMNF